jgi:uncharacterized protein (TIGR03437 family)
MMKTHNAHFVSFALSFAILFGFLAREAKAATLLYAMTENGLLYRSADGAKTWQNIALPATPGQFDALAVDPENSSNLYVNISLRGKAGPGQQSNYFFRSADGGATWSQSTLPGITQVVTVDPTASNILYAGIGGLYRSTDSGVTWSKTSITTFAESIGTDAHHAGVLYVPTTDGKIYKSTDFGATWTALAGSLPSGFNRLLTVAADPNNSGVLWGTGEGSCLDSNKNPFICGLVQSSDDGKTWQAISSVKGWFKNVVVDARNGNIYAGGQDDTLPVASQALAVKSTDGGKTWTKITTGMSKYSVEVHLDPENATTLYVEQANLIADLGPGGGVYASTDNGATWTPHPVDASQGQFDVVYALGAVSTSAALPPPTGNPTITAMVSAGAYGGFSSVAPGSWVEIYGSGLASTTRSWAGTDFNGSTAPTTLDGVTVNIGGQLAFIDYISSSPGQINAQLPSNIAIGGTLQVTVTNGTVTSAPFNIKVNPLQPGLLAPASFQIGGKQYVVALLPDGTYVLPPGSIAGLASRQAHPGETIVMYGIGFGSVSPSFPAGQIVTAANQLTQSFQLLFGQTPAQLPYAGLAPNYVGLYQFDVMVPPVPDNDLVPLTFNLGGAPGTQTLFIAVHQ